MGTNLSIGKLQDEIRHLIRRLGITQNQAARLIYTEINDFDDDEEIRRFEEKFKKQLQRETTKAECLQEYFDLLTKQYETRKGNMKSPKAVKPKILSAFLADQMRGVSERLDASEDD